MAFREQLREQNRYGVVAHIEQSGGMNQDCVDLFVYAPAVTEEPMQVTLSRDEARQYCVDSYIVWGVLRKIRPATAQDLAHIGVNTKELDTECGVWKKQYKDMLRV
ncbi:MAG TPA: hypothetical protein VLH19_02635 [Patescibacteria group bacterium]|nr:hypothetical protein [Patescibacteria group bacterium]